MTAEELLAQIRHTRLVEQRLINLGPGRDTHPRGEFDRAMRDASLTLRASRIAMIDLGVLLFPEYKEIFTSISDPV